MRLPSVLPHYRQMGLSALLAIILLASVVLLLVSGIPVLLVVSGAILVVVLEYVLSRWGTEVSIDTIPMTEVEEHATLTAALSMMDGVLSERVQLSIGRTSIPTSFVRYTPAGLTLVVTDGLIEALEPDELRAIFVHENTHIDGHHPQMYVLGQATSVLAGFAVFWTVVLRGLGSGPATVGTLAFWTLWIGGGNAILSVLRYLLSFGTELGVLFLVMALSRNNEYLADAAVEANGYRFSLISALKTVKQRSVEEPSSLTESPSTIQSLSIPSNLLRSHPPVVDRISRLERTE